MLFFTEKDSSGTIVKGIFDILFCGVNIVSKLIQLMS